VSLCIISQALCLEDIWGSGTVAPPFLTSALDGGEWSASRPCRFTPGERAPWYPLDRRLVGPQSCSGRCGEKTNLELLGIESRLSSPYIACCYTSWAVPTPVCCPDTLEVYIHTKPILWVIVWVSHPWCHQYNIRGKICRAGVVMVKDLSQ
jgi:hypothetical protein